MTVKGIWYPEIAVSTQGSFVIACQFAMKCCRRPAMETWLASIKERPKLFKNDFTRGRLKFSFSGSYLHWLDLQLLLETLGWNIVLTWLSSWKPSPAPSPASEILDSPSGWEAW